MHFHWFNSKLVVPLGTELARVRALVHGAVLNEVGSRREALVALRAGVRPVAIVQVLVLQQDVLVAKAPIADGALVRLLADMSEPDVPDEAVLVAKLLAAQSALKRTCAQGDSVIVLLQGAYTLVT